MDKRIPQRRCIGCGQTFPKKDLVRIVRDKLAGVNPDPGAGLSGRGAYICRSMACLERARKRKGLERSYCGPVPAEVYDSLARTLQEILSTCADKGD